MNAKTVTDGQLAQLAVKQHELFQRAKKGVYSSFDEMLDALQQVIEGKTPTIPVLAAAVIVDIFHFTVDYNLSLEAMIAAGQYDWKNNDITWERFPVQGDGIVEYKARYFHFNRDISSENAIAAIKEVGWEPAKIEHVLSHGKTFPEEQRKFPIIGLGSPAGVGGGRRVPFLDEGGSGRSLRLNCWLGGWGARYRFLAVRKVSGA